MSHLQAPLSRSSLVPFKVLYETAQKRGIVGNNKYMGHDGGNGKNSAISLASENTNMMHFDGSKETERIHYRELTRGVKCEKLNFRKSWGIY